MSSRDKIRVTRERAENVETSSSPQTYGSGAILLPESCLPDVPTVSNIVISSAVAGLNAAQAATATAEDGSVSRLSTHRVETLTFDLDRVSPPIANMFRRILATEVPTCAFDRILIEENDGVVLDEILSHRLGLCPIAAPVEQMEYIIDSTVSFSKLDGLKCIAFDLDVVGKPNQPITPVYSGDLKWVPLSGQQSWTEDDVFMVHKDILLAKLGPNQRIKLRAIAVKGLGLSHSKWSPVSSCYYDMKTEISFTQAIEGEAAEQLRKACPMRVFDIEDSGAAIISHPRQCSLCRECLRVELYPAFADIVKLEKKKSSVHFSIETLGQLSAETVFVTGLKLFAERMRDLAATVKASEVKVTAQRV